MAKAKQQGHKIQDHPNIKARVMPNNFEAEQAVLGSIMIDSSAALHCLSALTEDDFYAPNNKRVFGAMVSLYAKNSPIDLITLNQQLETDGAMEQAGGIAYIAGLTNIVPSASNHRHYSGIVKKNSVLRSLISSSQRIMDTAFSGDEGDGALDFAEAEIFALAEKQDRSSLTNISQPLKDAIARMEELYNDPRAAKGLPTGFSGLDRMLNGLQKSDLILLGARPGQGKTSIGMNIVANAALNKTRKTETGKIDPYKCAVFSLEMPNTQLAKRMLCSVGGINMSNASRGELTNPDWERLFRAKKDLAEAHIYIDDSSLTTPMEILSKCRRLKREQGLDLIMIDYLQLMSSGKRAENRNLEVSEITRTLKIAAKELNVPILLLSQLSRDAAKGEKRKPQLTDLRESGAIEQDADIVMFIYREHEQGDLTISEAERNKVELIIAKHRNGETGSVELKWHGPTVSFVDPDRDTIGQRDLNRLASIEPPPQRGNTELAGIKAQYDVPPDIPVEFEKPVKSKKTNDNVNTPKQPLKDISTEKIMSTPTIEYDAPESGSGYEYEAPPEQEPPPDMPKTKGKYDELDDIF
ncbi:MAG: replicative DNA helicase [Firmicutes bacterium]|nr:replicative DNA helicase [Bacillota bacterium]